MSIALNARIKEMQEQLARIKETMGRIEQIDKRIEALEDRLLARLTALENRPKPGRPPKNG